MDNFELFIRDGTRHEIITFLTAYNKWVENQLKIGGLIFSPKDYFGIWQGSAKC